MKTIRVKKDGKFLDMFEVLDVVRSVKTFRISKPKNENENENEEILYVTFFRIQSNNKHAYLTIIEPSYTSITEKTIKIRELGLEIRTETDSKAIISYVVKSIPLDEDLMLFLLLDKLNLLDYDLEEEDDIIYFE